MLVRTQRPARRPSSVAPRHLLPRSGRRLIFYFTYFMFAQTIKGSLREGAVAPWGRLREPARLRGRFRDRYVNSLWRWVRTLRFRLFSSSVSPKGCHLPRWGRLMIIMFLFPEYRYSVTENIENHILQIRLDSQC